MVWLSLITFLVKIISRFCLKLHLGALPSNTDKLKVALIDLGLENHVMVTLPFALIKNFLEAIKSLEKILSPFN